MTVEEIKKVKDKIFKHSKMDYICYRIYSILLDNELFPIGMLGIQEEFKTVVQDVRNELFEELCNNPK